MHQTFQCTHHLYTFYVNRNCFKRLLITRHTQIGRPISFHDDHQLVHWLNTTATHIKAISPKHFKINILFTWQSFLLQFIGSVTFVQYRPAWHHDAFMRSPPTPSGIFQMFSLYSGLSRRWLYTSQEVGWVEWVRRSTWGQDWVELTWLYVQGGEGSSLTTTWVGLNGFFFLSLRHSSWLCSLQLLKH